MQVSAYGSFVNLLIQPLEFRRWEHDRFRDNVAAV